MAAGSRDVDDGAQNEAQVPELLPSRRPIFIDDNRLRSPDTLTQDFDYENDYQSFTEEEQLMFAAAFKDTPKDFGRIAILLVGRTVKDCIRHYYAWKADGRFKTESKKERRAQKGHHDGGDDNDKKNDEDEDVVPIDREIARLRKRVPGSGKLYRKAYPRLAHEPTVLPRPDLSIFRPSFGYPFNLSDEQLVAWLRSADILPLVKQWKAQCLDISEMFLQMQRLLMHERRPWPVHAEKIADHAGYYGEEDFVVNTKSGKALALCARFAIRIANGNDVLFSQFTGFAFGKHLRLVAATRVLFTAYDDLTSSSKGFFAVLVKTELADLVKYDVRKSWEKKYPFEGEGQDSDMHKDVDSRRSVPRDESTGCLVMPRPQPLTEPLNTSDGGQHGPGVMDNEVRTSNQKMNTAISTQDHRNHFVAPRVPASQRLKETEDMFARQKERHEILADATSMQDRDGEYLMSSLTRNTGERDFTHSLPSGSALLRDIQIDLDCDGQLRHELQRAREEMQRLKDENWRLRDEIEVPKARRVEE